MREGSTVGKVRKRDHGVYKPFLNAGIPFMKNGRIRAVLIIVEKARPM